MPGMEGIIRPFINRDVSPRAGFAKTITKIKENPKFVWGKGGSCQTGGGNYDIAVKCYMEKVERERTNLELALILAKADLAVGIAGGGIGVVGDLSDIVSIDGNTVTTQTRG